MVSVDRLDYSKGLVERFTAFERLLERTPAHRGQVTFVQIAPPSRSDVEQYRQIRRQLKAPPAASTGAGRTWRGRRCATSTNPMTARC